MRQPTRGGPAPQVSDDVLALFVVAVLFGAPILAMLSGAGDGIATWLVEHHVLTRDDVLLTFAASAGLDLGRIVIAVGVLLGLLAWAVHAAQQRRSVDRRPGVSPRQ